MRRRSTKSERTRIKTAGLGVDKDVDNTTAFRDFDEVIASPLAEWKRPWWVRWVDTPTVEIDWDNMKRFDGTKMQQVSWRKYVGEEEAQRLGKLREERTKQWILENKPGYTLRERALDIAGSQAGSVGVSQLGSWAEPDPQKEGTGSYYVREARYAGTRLRDPFRARPLSPQEQGVPQWEGSPEENARMIRAALRHFGADQVGFLELNERIRKLIYSHDALDGKLLEFENVELAYETDQKRVIPDRARWIIVFSVQMSEELIKRRSGRTPTALSSSATGLAYGRARNIMDRLQTFLRVLGYQGIMGTWFNGLGIAPALGVMAGLGELSRLNRLIGPEHGPMQRIFRVITDLPLAPTKPINAGIMRFCRTCKICAEKCPADVLSMETEPSWEVAGPWNNPGHKAYFENSVACRTWWSLSTVGCSTCFAVCPFSKKDRSFLHKVVKATISATPLFNRLHTRMDEVFGYQRPKDLEAWWKLNLPRYGTGNVKGTQLD